MSSAIVSSSGASSAIGFQAVSMTGAPKIAATWEALKDVLDECNFMFSKKGIQINSLDFNEIALINLTFWPHAFQRYICTKNYICGLNMVMLFKAFKVCGKQTQVTLQIAENDPEAVFLCMANPASGFRAEVTLKAFGHQKKMLKIENSVFNRFVSMPSTDFQSMIGYISSFSSSGDDDNKVLTIDVFEDSVEFSSEGQFGRTRVVVQQTNTGMQVTQGAVDALDDERARAGEDALTGAVDGGDDDDDATEPSRKRKRVVGRGSAAAAEAVVEAAAATAAAAAAMASSSVPGNKPEPLMSNRYNLKYLKYFTKATALSPTVRIFLRAKFPVILTYTIGTMGVLHYCLGPAIAENGEEAIDDAEEPDVYATDAGAEQN